MTQALRIVMGGPPSSPTGGFAAAGLAEIGAVAYSAMPRVRPAAGLAAGVLTARPATAVGSTPPVGVRAFPGASGWGAGATGGRGGTIYRVNNEAQLRAAVQASGPRTIVFTTGGTYTLTSALTVSNGDLTIMGQTAPGGGVTLAGHMFQISASNVIVRGIRVRNANASTSTAGWDTFRMLGPSNPANAIHDIIIDHCSVSWSIDEVLTFFGATRNVTMSWNIISEPLNLAQHDGNTTAPHEAHGMGVLLGGTEGGVVNASFHHNICAHFKERMIRVQGTQNLEVVSNLMYGWTDLGMQIDRYTAGINLWPQVNIISNWWKANSQSNTDRHIRFSDSVPTPAVQIAYLDDNITPTRTSDSQAQWLAVAATDQGKIGFQRPTPFPMSSYPIAVTPRSQLLATLTPAAGAVAVRDAVDTRIVNQAINGTGGVINADFTGVAPTLSSVGGFPTLAAGTYPTDSNADGIPDAWAAANGMGSAAANAVNPVTGYTWIEDYGNSLLPGGVAADPGEPADAAVVRAKFASPIVDNTYTMPTGAGYTDGSNAATAVNAFLSGKSGAGSGHYNRIVFPSGQTYTFTADKVLDLQTLHHVIIDITGATLDCSAVTGASALSSAFFVATTASHDIIIRGGGTGRVVGGMSAYGTAGAAAQIDESIGGICMRRGSYNVEIDGIRFERQRGWTIWSSGDGSGTVPQYLWVHDCYVQGGEGGIAITAGQHVVVERNRFEDLTYYWLDYEPDTSTGHCTDSVIQYNDIVRFGVGGSFDYWLNMGRGYSGSTYSQMSRHTIRNNHTIEGHVGGHAGGMSVNAAGDLPKVDIVITGNVSDTPRTVDAGGMRWAYVNNLTITGNTQITPGHVPLVQEDSNPSGTHVITPNVT